VVPGVMGGWEGARPMELFRKRVVSITCSVGSGLEFRQFELDWGLDGPRFGFWQGQ
jgi:hypothetical protein